jgi:hypothetical protein
MNNSENKITVDLGMSAPSLVTELVRIMSVRTLTLIRYFPSMGLEERLAARPSTELDDVFQLAEQLRLILGRSLPYWESILLAARKKLPMPQLIAEAVVHAPNESDLRFEQPADDIQQGSARLIAALRPSEVLGICSRVELQDGTVAHIPMLDFRCDAETTPMDEVLSLLRALGESRGIVLSSGRSFHYYGLRPLSECAWRAFTSRALLAAPIVDSRYVAHRLLEGMATLRLTASGVKPIVPKVVAILA